MTEYSLSKLRVSIGQPRVLTEGIGHRWFPRMGKFASGTVYVRYSLAADSSNLLVKGTGIYFSSDGGETWPLHYDFGEAPELRVPQPDGSIAGPVYETYLTKDGSPSRPRGHYAHLEDNGRRYVLEPWGAYFNGLPNEVGIRPIHGQHGETKKTLFFLHGDVVDIGSGVLGTAYLKYAGDTKYTTVAITSQDGGRSWNYLSTVASHRDLPGAQEGPCEPATIRLTNNDLMCVMRSGAAGGRRLWRSYSHDNGQTWSPVEQLAASSVDPTLCRLTNGALLLTTGRPSVKLWVSNDERGEHWESLDIIDHHNRQLNDEKHQIIPIQVDDPAERERADQTTGYTAMIEVSPNRVLLAYDRTPIGWRSVPADSDERGRIYVLSLEVTRP